MKKWLVAASGVLILLAFATYSLISGPPPEKQMFTLRVMSSRLGHEVEFEAAFFFRTDDSPLQFVQRGTPFEVEGQGDLILGIFRKTAGEADLQVELLSRLDDDIRKLVSASGSRVILGENVLEEVPRFIRGF